MRPSQNQKGQRVSAVRKGVSQSKNVRSKNAGDPTGNRQMSGKLSQADSGPVSVSKPNNGRSKPLLDMDEKRLHVGDEHLAQDIRQSIRREKFLSAVATNIRVQVENRVVTLEGQVTSKDEKMLAADKAAAFVGYKRVNNRLHILHR